MGRHDDADEAPIVVLNDGGGGRGPPFVLDLGTNGAPVVAMGGAGPRIAVGAFA